MQPVTFIEKNRTYTKPAGWTDEQCGDLDVFEGPDGQGNTIVISKWQPTDEDRAAIAAGGDVWLRVFGAQPPVFLTTEYPFVKVDPETVKAAIEKMQNEQSDKTEQVFTEEHADALDTIDAE